MGSDFNSCRFDFRLDVKTGLLPSRRRSHGCLTVGTRRVTTVVDRAPPRTERADCGGQCTTLYSCKICGCLLRSRADRKTHTLQHKQLSGTHHSYAAEPSPGLGNCSLSQSLLLTLGVTHGLRSSDSDVQPTTAESSALEVRLSPELAAANFNLLRSSVLLPLAEVSPDSCDRVAKEDVVPDATTSPLDDVTRSRDRDSTSGIASTSAAMHESDSGEIICSSDRQSNAVVDLTTKAADSDHGRLPVLSTGNSDFRSPLVRQRKSYGLDLMVQKLWQFKLRQQQQQSAGVAFRDLERSRSHVNGDSTGSDRGSPSRRYDEAATQTHKRSSFETAVGKVSRPRSPGHDGEGHVGAQLMLRRVVAAPGGHPRFYTSLMKLQSSRRKTQPTQVSRLSCQLKPWLYVK